MNGEKIKLVILCNLISKFYYYGFYNNIRIAFRIKEFIHEHKPNKFSTG